MKKRKTKKTKSCDVESQLNVQSTLTKMISFVNFQKI